jgi:hypothetical protein
MSRWSRYLLLCKSQVPVHPSTYRDLDVGSRGKMCLVRQAEHHFSSGFVRLIPPSDLVTVCVFYVALTRSVICTAFIVHISEDVN